MADPDPDGAGAPATTPPAVTAPMAAPAGGLDSAPLVTPMGKFEVHGTLPILSLDEPAPTATDPGATATTTVVFLDIGATYGAIDKLEVGADYAVAISPSGNGTLNAHAAYAALHNDKLDLALAADISLDLESGGTDILAVGAWARYHVAPKISVFTGNPGLPHSTLLGGSFALPGQYQLAFGLNNGNAITLGVPVGVGLQATPQIYAFFSTTVAAFALSGGGSSAFLFSDFIPVNIGAYYSVNDKLDVGAEFSDDLKDAGDAYIIAFSGRYWVK